MAKKINPKMILADINAGMDKHALMSKYGLSATQFESAMRKLNEAGFLTDHQVMKPADAPLGAHSPSKCPACATPLPEGLDECPKCGVIFAKYHTAVEELPPKDTSHRVPLPDLLKGESVKVEQRSPLVWIGALAGFVIIVAVAAFFFFRSSSEAPAPSGKAPEPAAVTVPAESPSTPETGSEATETSEEAGVESSSASPEEPRSSGPTDSQPETEGETAQTAVAIPPKESTLAEDEAAVQTPEKSSEQSDVGMEKELDLLGQSMIQDFDRAVRQWTSDDFRRFAAQAKQTLGKVSVEGLPDAIRQTGEDLILQLQLESPETAGEAFRQLAALIRPELNRLSKESKTKFIKAAQEIKRDIETSITR